MTGPKKKTKRKIPSRKLRSRRKPDRLAEARHVASAAAAMMPETAQVISAAAHAAFRAFNQAAIDELSKADAQLAAQLVAILAKKRSG